MDGFAFEDDDEFQVDAHGRQVKVHCNGEFENGKVLFVQHHWTWDEFLCAASQRIEMVPIAKRVFNADGTEVDDLMCIEDDDLLFLSSGGSFKAPTFEKGRFSDQRTSRGAGEGFSGIVGGYRVGSFLGRGGFGEVRLGVHQLTGEEVALKFILKSEIGNLGDVDRTITEIQCLTALNHPNIIKLLRVIDEAQHLVLVFELLEGGDAFHYLRQMPAPGLSEEEGCKLFTQILAGVGYAHTQHICHRDLKLENILLAGKTDFEYVKIADFGLSGFYRPGATMKTNCGSISYLAPEVFRGTCNAGPPLDVWSLGVILYAIVCGRLPFEGNDLNGTSRAKESVLRNRILKCQYKLDDSFSPELKDLIKKMLKPDPSERATIPEIFNSPWIRGRYGGCAILEIPGTPLDNAPNPALIETVEGSDGGSSHEIAVLEAMTNDVPKLQLDDAPVCEARNGSPTKSSAPTQGALKNLPGIPARAPSLRTMRAGERPAGGPRNLRGGSLSHRNLRRSHTEVTTRNERKEEVSATNARTRLPQANAKGGSTIGRVGDEAKSPLKVRLPKTGGAEDKSRRRSTSSSPEKNSTKTGSLAAY